MQGMGAGLKTRPAPSPHPCKPSEGWARGSILGLMASQLCQAQAMSWSSPGCQKCLWKKKHPLVCVPVAQSCSFPDTPHWAFQETSRLSEPGEAASPKATSRASHSLHRAHKKKKKKKSRVVYKKLFDLVKFTSFSQLFLI